METLKIDWDMLNMHLTCPLWRHYLYQENRVPNGFKDQQYLVKRKCYQEVLGRLAEVREETQASLVQFVTDLVGKIFDQTPGIFGISRGELARHIVARAIVVREMLLSFWERENLEPLPGRVFRSGDTPNLVLEATTDLITRSTQDPIRYSFWDARATKNVKKAKLDKSLWVISVARTDGIYTGVTTAYEVFFEAGEIKLVTFNPDWLSMRDSAIVEIMLGSRIPKPSAANCRVCDFRDYCTAKHVPKPRGVKVSSFGLGLSQAGGVYRGIF